jgi:NitT/TauT family transport system substrate-binding protein
MHIMQSRRDFLTTLSTAGAASILGARASLADEGTPETTIVRLHRDPSICVAPQYLAKELLRLEGFTDVRYVPVQNGLALAQMIARGELDFSFFGPASLVFRLDTGVPMTALAGVHSGCFELFAHEPVRTISDLKGKKVGIDVLGSGRQLYVALLAAHVGLNPKEDIEWVEESNLNPMEMFADGKVDAFLGYPPEPQELRARKVGRVILSTATDKPWSQYFCCTLAGNREFVRAHPMATKRVLRAILKAADICAAEPEQVTRRMVEDGFTERYDYALETLTGLPYDIWHQFDPEDSLRFFALRLREVDMIKSTPQQIIAEGTDWRFLNELKRELKA